MAPTCELGELTGQEVTAARQFLFEASKGAIAWFAAHGGTHSAHTFWLGQEIYNQILEHKVTTLGPATVLAKKRFMEKYPDAKNTAKQFLFLGDPALILSKGSGLSDVTGELPADRTWGGYTTITGDVTVPAGQTLEIKPYAFVEFENDAELKVYGTLIASGDVFSANADIVFYEGAQVTITGDLTLPLGAELTIKPGVEVEFLANTDGTGGGRDRTRSELLVKGTLDADAGNITFRSANDPATNADWYGIRVASGGIANLSGATIRDGSRCVQNEGGTLTMTNVTLSNCGATVTLDPTLPYAGREITATLTTPVGDLTAKDAQWQWHRRRSTDAWTDITSAETATYTPDARNEDTEDEGDEGWELRATVRYQAEANVYPHAQSAATVPVAGVPDAPPHFMPFPGDGQVVLWWDAAAANGSPIVRYEVQSRPVADPPQDWSSWATVSGGSSARDTTVTGLTNGVLYEFAVRAVNGVGAGASASQSATPQSSIVRIPLTGSRGDGQVTLNWSAPSGSVSIHEYQIRRRISDSGQDWSSWVEVSGGSTARDTTVTGLTNGTTYQFQVQAVDSQEAPVAVSDVVSATPAAVPDAPPHFMPFPGDGQVLLEWEAAANNGSPIARYEIQWRQVSDPAQPWSDWDEVSGGRSARDTTMTGLTNGQRYEFAVRAVNGVGDGASIAQVAMPQALSLTASRGDGRVGLRWTFSAHSSTIAHYQVRQRISDSGQDWSDWAEVSGGTSARSKTVMGLTNGVTYQFQVQALDSEGTSVSVSAIVSATPAGLPDAPPHFMPFPGDGQVLLEWEAAANNGSRITRYEIQWRRVSNPAQAWSDWDEVSGGRSARDTTMTGLTNGQLHEFAVRAVNGVGDGASIAQVAMPRALSLTASGGDGQVGLHWTFSAHSSTIAHYQVRQRISDSGQDWSSWATVPGGTTARDTTVTGLTNGTTYQFQAQAIDSQDASISVSNIESATPQQPSPGPVRNLRAEGGSASGSIAVSWDAPNTGGTPALYRVEYRQGSAAWQAGGTTTQTSLSIGDLVGGGNYSIQVRAEHGGGHSRWQSTTATATGTETEYAYRLHDSGTTAPTFSASASSVPTDWSSSRQTPTSSNRYEWRIRRTRPTGGSWSSWGSATVVVEAEYAYRASQTAPLFDTGASGTPDNWSSSELTWTDAAPRVWSIRRTSPSGGTWSAWGTLEKYSERPAAQPDPFYRQAASQPDPPGNTTSSATPTDWQTSNPGATATKGVWRTERTRPAGETHYRFSAPIQIQTEYAYRLHTSGTTAPSFTASSSGVPTDWSSSRQPPTSAYAPYEWQIRRTRPTGGTWSSWSGATVVATYTEYQYAYKRHTSGTTAPAFSSTASGVPYGWSSSQPSATSSNRYVWRISRTQPAGGSWSSWGSASVVSKYTERGYAYKRNDSGTTAPSFSSTSSGVPYGWSSSQPSATSGNRYVWRISRTRPAGGSWSSWGSATVVSRYTERGYAYKRNDSGTTAPSFSSTSSGVPYGWSSSQPSATSSNRYVWRISRTRPAGGSWSSWGSASVVSKYTERGYAYKRNDSGTTAPSFSSTSSGVPYGWSSSQPSATSGNRYVWQISRTRPAGGSWSSWGSATVVSRYGSSAYRLDNSYLQPLAFTTASGLPTGWGSARQMPTLSKPRLGGRVAVQPG